MKKLALLVALLLGACDWAAMRLEACGSACGEDRIYTPRDQPDEKHQRMLAYREVLSPSGHALSIECLCGSSDAGFNWALDAGALPAEKEQP